MVLGVWIYDTIRIVGTMMMGGIPAQGGGDAKLMAMVGAWSSWKVVLLAGGISSTLSLLGFGVVAAHTMLKGGGIKTGAQQLIRPLPLGPAIALGATVALFAGDRTIAAYQQFMASPYRDPCTILLLIVLSALLYWTRKMRLQGS
jgi:leader peptidase (prepilin peptidase) / N-methyltransferase